MEINVFVETKVTAEEQILLGAQLRRRGYNAAWSAPVQLKGGKAGAGRTGGVSIFAKNEWDLYKDEGTLELECPDTCWLAVWARNVHRDEACLLIAYYGHPMEKDRTKRDMVRIQELIRVAGTPAFLLGDFNVQEDFIGIEDHSVMVDAAIRFNGNVEGGPPTYISHDAQTRLDRIYVDTMTAEAIDKYEVVDDLAVPQHRSVILHLHRRTQTMLVATPLKEIELLHVDDQFNDDQIIAQLQQEWAAKACGDADAMYALWSQLWEGYLIAKFKQSNPPQRGRGRPLQPRKEVRATLRPKSSMRLLQLSSYVKRLEVVSCRSLSDMDRQHLWQKLAGMSKQMACRYGIPALPADLSIDNVHVEIARTLHEHFKKSLEAETAKHRQDAAQRHRERLHRNHGVNQLSAGIMKGRTFRMPIIEDEGRVVGDPQLILDKTQQAWAQYFDKTQKVQDERWSDAYLSSLRTIACSPRLTTPQSLQKIVKRAKSGTAAGPDSWHVKELQALPLAAYEQFLQIMQEAELQGQVPAALCQSWTALIPPQTLPCKPTKMRPIAILPVLWRIWAKAYLEELEEWTQQIMPSTLHSYQKGKSAADAATRLSMYMEDAMINPGNGPIFAAGLDASKAFPSVSRCQLHQTLLHLGMPLKYAKMMESVYVNGRTHYRILGRFVCPRDHQLKRGIHQGCPLSVMAFNGLQLPLLHKLEKEYPGILIMSYADDLVVCTKDKAVLEEVLSKIAAYMEAAEIMVNPEKTRFWTTSGKSTPLSFQGQSIDLVHSVTFLGIQFDDSTVLPKPDGDNATIRSATQLLARLPLALDARQELYGAVVVPRMIFCPWKVEWTPKAITAARSSLISVMRPALHKGARAQGIVLMYLLKGHRIDPLLAQLLRLLRILTRIGETAIDRVQLAQQHLVENYGPTSAAAKLCTSLGIRIENGYLHYDTFEPLQLTNAVMDRHWSHKIREICRLAIVRPAIAHRTAFQEILCRRVDWEKSLSLVRSLGNKPRQRVALELVLSDGLLTAERTQKFGKIEKRACPHGCDALDTATHRFWECKRWQSQRKMWGVCPESMPEMVRRVGLFPLDSEVPLSEVKRIQAWMSMVVTESAEYYWQPMQDKAPQRQKSWTTKRISEAGHVSLGSRFGETLRTTTGNDYDHDVGPKTPSLPCEFHARHDKGIGPASQPPRKRQATSRTVALPPHITATRRQVVGAKAVSILVCSFCRAEMSGHNRRRFVDLHVMCAADVTTRCPKRILTKAEKLSVTFASGRELDTCSQGKRRRLIAAAVL